ncbi:MAG: endonuclease/exonuclease/phosphatase family protein, partial [Chloroflexota bacterium]|nr:endonuclease/exonuclease/phosphatase family protein [Chloroflexota bacterium]
TKIPRLRRSRRHIGPIVLPASFHTERRLAEVRRLCEMIDSIEGPLLVMGDFNFTERSEDYALVARRLTDAYRVAGRGLGHTFPAWLTFAGRLPTPFPSVRLDHVWHSEHFRTVNARLGPTAGSDHHPVIVRLARRA